MITETAKKPSLGDYIKQKRTELGYTRTYVAFYAGISDSLLYKIENKGCQPSPSILLELGKTLGFSLDDVKPSYRRAMEIELEQEILTLEREVNDIGVPVVGFHKRFRRLQEQKFYRRLLEDLLKNRDTIVVGNKS